MNFKQYIQEKRKLSEARGAVTHLEHLEDLVFMNGIQGVEFATDLVRSFIDTLNQGGDGAVVNMKLDGAPSVLFGADPREGRNNAFFVGTKSVFNKGTPKLAHNHDEIDEFYGYNQAVADKLHAIFDGLKSVFTGNKIFQTELLFVPGDKKTKQIDGMKHIVFSPNTITYAIPIDNDSKLYKRVNNADFGLVINQQYSVSETGYDDPIDVTAENVNFDSATVQKMIDAADQNGFFLDSAIKESIEGLDVNENQIETKLDMIESYAQKIDTVFNQNWIEDNPVIKAIKKFINKEVREATGIAQGNADFRKFKKRLLKFVEQDDRLSGRVKGTIKELVKKEEQDLSYMIEIFNILIDVKHDIIGPLRKLMGGKFGKTFIKKDDVFEVTDDEGFVISVEGDVIKFIDRLTFSRANLRHGRFQ